MIRKRILTVCLCLALLGGSLTVLADPGGADDPLISLSYLMGTFLPQVRAALADTAESALASGGTLRAGDGCKVFYLPAGKSLSLGAGFQFTLLDGAVNATVTGELCDVSRGGSISGGSIRLYCRHIVCEDSQVYLDALEDSVVKATASAVQVSGTAFLDVPRDSWFYSDVNAAFRRGLVNGMTDSAFEPSGTLTGAQCVKLAACMHQLWSNASVSLENSESGPWYRSYVDYALQNGIIDRELDDYNAPVSRGRFVRIFYRALPESAYRQINVVPDGAIPDVQADAPYAREVYAFYRAGILTGYEKSEQHEEFAFGPDSEISRAEMATIMNRMFDSAARQRFSITEI